MIPALRARFNADWTPDALRAAAGARGRHAPACRSGSRCRKRRASFRPRCSMRWPTPAADLVAALPRRCAGPGRGRGAHSRRATWARGRKRLPTCVQVDFGLVRTAGGGYEPRLVELQAFPSLYGFQHALAEAYRQVFALPADLLPLSRRPRPDRLPGPAARRAHRRSRPGRRGADGDRAGAAEDAARFRHHQASVGHRHGRSPGPGRAGPAPVAARRTAASCRCAASTTASSPTSSNAPGTRCRSTSATISTSSGSGHPAWYFRLSKSAIPWLAHPSVPRTWRLDLVTDLPAERRRSGAEAALLVCRRRHHLRADRGRPCGHPARAAASLPAAGARGVRAGHRHAPRGHAGRGAHHVRADRPSAAGAAAHPDGARRR